jgi:hypothetical protein
MRKSMTVAAMLLVAAAGSISAQAPAGAPKGAPKAAPTLVFEREVYEYPGGSRRDPFRPLTTNDTSGPLFSELTVTGIMYYTDSSRSMATIRDLSKKEYRVRRGDVIGNATVQFVDKYRVVFSVEEFGMKRQEVLEIKSTRAGA